MAARQPILSIITCTEDSRGASLLRNSLQGNPGLDDLEFIVSRKGESIAQKYNAGAAWSRGKFLLFTHADVEVLCSRNMLKRALREISKPEMGVLGVAGSKNLNEDATWWQPSGGHLSGACMHTDSKSVWMTAYGNYGRVVVLDGVFLLVSRQVYANVGGFDEDIPGYDFYDIDFTLRTHLSC
jgi:GT2 family glycosyltransferase